MSASLLICACGTESGAEGSTETDAIVDDAIGNDAIGNDAVGSCTDFKCADGNPCTKDSCDSASGSCKHEAEAMFGLAVAR